MYVVYHDANNVSNFGDDPMTQLNLKNVLFTLFYGHVRYAVTVSAAVATCYAITRRLQQYGEAIPA